MPWLSKKSTDKTSSLTPYSRIHHGALTTALAVVIGILAGFGAVLFTYLIHFVTRVTVEPFLFLSRQNTLWLIGLCMVPALGLLAVSWFTRRFAPEAQGTAYPR